jgi:hypothetical protein
VFAAVFFLRYSIDRGWLTAPIRMTIGLVVGVGLLVGCELRAARRYPVTANALDAAGTATLFATLFAAHALWDLVPQVPTFVAMAVVAAVAVMLSVRHDSVFIALLGLLGGVATPALLSSGENRPIGLFGYLLLLNVGCVGGTTAVVLTVGSVVLTTPTRPGLRTDQSRCRLRWAFPRVPDPPRGGAAVAGRERSRRRSRAWPSAPAAAAPSVSRRGGAELRRAPGLLFGFVLVIGAGLALVAAVRGPAELHLVGALGTVLAFLVWCATSYGSAHWPGILVWVVLAMGLYLAAPAVAVRFGRTLDESGAVGSPHRRCSP